MKKIDEPMNYYPQNKWQHGNIPHFLSFNHTTLSLLFHWERTFSPLGIDFIAIGD